MILDVSTNEIVTQPQSDQLLRSDQEGLSADRELEGWRVGGSVITNFGNASRTYGQSVRNNNI